MDSLFQAFIASAPNTLSPELSLAVVRLGISPLFSSAYPPAYFLGLIFLSERLRKPWRFLFLGLALFLLASTFFHTEKRFSYWRVLLFAGIKYAAKYWEIRPNRLWVFLLSLGLAAICAPTNLPALLLIFSASLSAYWAWQAGFRWLTLPISWLLSLPIHIYFFPLLNPIAPVFSLFLGTLWGALVLIPSMLNQVFFHNFAAYIFQKSFHFCSSYSGQAVWVRKEECIFLFLGFSPLLVWRKKVFLIPAAIMLCLLPKLSAVEGARVLDVGQGDSILLFHHGTLPFLVDSGPPAWKGPVAPAAARLEANGVAGVAGILLTHPDLDHYGGVDSILSRHPLTGSIWIHPRLLDSPKASKLLAMLERHQAAIHLLGSDQKIFEGLACHLAPAENSNEVSPLCRFVRSDGQVLLLTGDMDEKNERYFLNQDLLFLKADALKVAHHGSKTSSSAAFLAATKSKLAFISVGRKNRYHHPTQEALSRLKAAGIETHRTDESGDLAWYQ